MVILVWLRMHDHGMADACLFGELHILFHRFGRRLVSGVGMKWKTFLVARK